MIAVDTNLLVYAHRPECPLHDEARSCIAGLAESGRPFGIPIHCLAGARSSAAAQHRVPHTQEVFAEKLAALGRAEATGRQRRAEQG